MMGKVLENFSLTLGHLAVNVRNKNRGVHLNNQTRIKIQIIIF